MAIEPGPLIHPTAEIAAGAWVGTGTKVWNHCQIRDGASVGENCVIGSGVYIDTDVHVGDRCKVENQACLFRGVTVGDDVFIGPGALLLNDRRPRASNPTGNPKTDDDWEASPMTIGDGASVGAGCVVLAGCDVGAHAMVGAGSVVTRSVPAHALAYGNPARLHGLVCDCGTRLSVVDNASRAVCPACARTVDLGSSSNAVNDL